jgi:hypothetical protein
MQVSIRRPLSTEAPTNNACEAFEIHKLTLEHTKVHV